MEVEELARVFDYKKKQFSGVKKECFNAAMIHKDIGVKTPYRKWYKRYITDVKNYMEEHDYKYVKNVLWVTWDVMLQICRRAATQRSGEVDEMILRVYKNQEALVKIKALNKDFGIYTKEFKSLVQHFEGYNCHVFAARRHAMERLREQGSPMEDFSEGLAQEIRDAKITLTIKEMAKILGLTPKKIVGILGDMSILGIEFKQPPCVTERTKLYTSNWDIVTNIYKLQFDPVTLLLCDVKHELRGAMFWDVLGKKPKNLPATWLRGSHAAKWLRVQGSLGLGFLLE